MSDVHEMQVMDPTGHTTVKWDPKKSDDVEVARTTFDAMKAKGYNAFHVRMRGSPGERMTSFDPTAKSMILIPQLVGG